MNNPKYHQLSLSVWKHFFSTLIDMVATKDIDHATELDIMLSRMQDMIIDCKVEIDTRFCLYW